MKGVSVIVPVFKDLEPLKVTTNALLNQETNVDYEIIIVDNGSENDLVEWGIANKNIVFLQELDYLNSPYSCRNRGIEKANYDVLVFLDSTCVPKSDFIENGYNFMINNKYDIVGGNVLFDFKENITASKLCDSVSNIQMKSTIIERKGGKTANLWTRKTFVNQYEMFREGVRSGEDLRWTQDATKIGYTIAFNEECIVYKRARSFFELLKKQYRVGKGQVILWKNQKTFNTRMIRSFRKILPMSIKSFKLLLNRTNQELLSFNIKLRMYVVFYLADLMTLAGNISKMFKRGV